MTREEKISFLEGKAKEMRKTILTMIHEAHSGHPGGSLSATDIVTALYFDEMHVDPKDPKDPDRDRFILSKGHACPVQYSALAHLGYFPYETIYTLRQEGSILQGHPDMKRCPGIDISTGSLGQGLSCGVGMAIAGKRDHRNYRVFVVVGDGESDEGQIWEALETAAKYELDNLVVILDRNRIQNDDFCAEVMPNGDLVKKFEAFGCETQHINGHSMAEIVDALDNIRRSEFKGPHAIVAETVKGKGVSFMEDQPKWHGTAPNDEELRDALSEVEAM